jgi:hypothetical protein
MRLLGSPFTFDDIVGASVLESTTQDTCSAPAIFAVALELGCHETQ